MNGCGLFGLWGSDSAGGGEKKSEYLHLGGFVSIGWGQALGLVSLLVSLIRWRWVFSSFIYFTLFLIILFCVLYSICCTEISWLTLYPKYVPEKQQREGVEG